MTNKNLENIIKSIIIPIDFKPSIYDYIDNKIPYIRTYSNFIIKDCLYNNFKENSKIRILMLQIIKKYDLEKKNINLYLVNNSEWYDSFYISQK